MLENYTIEVFVENYLKDKEVFGEDTKYIYEEIFSDIIGEEIDLTEEDLLITMVQKEGFVTEADNNRTVVMDTTLTEELLEEGFVYEMISKIQTMRKEADFEVMDHIKVSVLGNEKLAEIVKKNEAMIAAKVLADSFEFSKEYANKKEWNVNGENVTICIEK